jgi:tRNA (guanine37-N1)-methyltransferase
VRFEVVTLFPEMFSSFVELGVVGRAVRDGHIVVRFDTPRRFGLGKHKSVDDTPYGGGAGMVMRVDCLVSCMNALDDSAPAAEGATAQRAHRVLLSPQGAPLTQRGLQRLASHPALMLICGRYEGVDERVRSYVDEELSLGDFVLSGGEVAAMAVVDACARLVPGVLGNPASLEQESHSPSSGGRLEYPHYTRPLEFDGRRVPEVLLGGNHAAIAAWRTARAYERTAKRRPDLLARDDGEESA